MAQKVIDIVGVSRKASQKRLRMLSRKQRRPFAASSGHE